MCVAHGDAERVEVLVQLGVVGAKVHQPDTLLLHQVEDVVIIVAFVLASQDEDGWRAHAFQRVPASVHVGCL